MKIDDLWSQLISAVRLVLNLDIGITKSTTIISLKSVRVPKYNIITLFTV